MVRISWDEYYMKMVRNVSLRATCPRKSVGAIIVNRKNEIVGSGYNGSPRGVEHCSDVGCLIKEINGKDHCIRTVHAEVNALLQAGKESDGATLYCTTLPCPNCFKLIVQAGIRKIIYDEDYNIEDLKYWFDNSDVEVVKWTS